MACMVGPVDGVKRMRHRIVCTLLSTLALSGCVSLVPHYRQDIVDRLTDVDVQISRIVATTAASAPAKPPYEKVEQFYIAAQGDVLAAMDIAAKRTRLTGKAASRPASGIEKQLAYCFGSLDKSRKYYRDHGGFDDMGDEAETMKQACLIAKNSEGFFRKSGG
jgi:hypothetical protein